MATAGTNQSMRLDAISHIDQSQRSLREIYEERKSLYEKFADRIIDVDDQSIETTAQELAKIARNG